MPKGTSSSSSRLAVLGAIAVLALVVVTLVVLDQADPVSPSEGGTGEPVVEQGQPSDVDALAPSDAGAAPEPLRPDGLDDLEGLDEPWALASSSDVAIVGRVIDALGQPVPEQDVGLYDDEGDFLDMTTTDADGSFELAWFDPLLAGWSVITEADPLVDPEDPGANAPAHHTHPSDHLPGDDPVVIELQLAPAPWITGIVYGADGRPAEAAQIELVSLESAWTDTFLDTWTELDGSFALGITEMPTERLVLRVSDMITDAVALRGPFALQPGERPYWEIHLRDSLTVRGRILDARDGVGLDGVEVKALAVHEQFDNAEAWDITWEEGRFTLEYVEAPEGQIWLHVLPDEHGPQLVHVRDPSRPVEVRLGPVLTLGGTLTDALTEEPVPDALVRVQLLGPAGTYGDEDSAMADGQGAYSLDLVMVPPEHGLLIVEADGYVIHKRRLDELPVALGSDRMTLDVELTPLPPM